MSSIFEKYGRYQTLGWRTLSLLLAMNYFCFRAELLSEENEKNHPFVDAFLHHPYLSLPTVNWETFDKDNAPKAIRVEPWISLHLIAVISEPPIYSKNVPPPFEPIRDKSPPVEPQA